LRAAGVRGARVAVDVHGEALAVLVADARPHLVKVNRAEASALLDPAVLDTPLSRLAAGVQDRGAGVVVITDGVRGSLARDVDGASWRAHSTAEPGVYSVGSGDSFLAGLVAALHDGAALPDALREAAACAAANVEAPGAAVFSIEALERARASVVVEPEA
jgi:fructose-1-phosphate kinase PfkB-like protein